MLHSYSLGAGLHLRSLRSLAEARARRARHQLAQQQRQQQQQQQQLAREDADLQQAGSSLCALDKPSADAASERISGDSSGVQNAGARLGKGQPFVGQSSGRQGGKVQSGGSLEFGQQSSRGACQGGKECHRVQGAAKSQVHVAHVAGNDQSAEQTREQTSAQTSGGQSGGGQVSGCSGNGAANSVVLPLSVYDEVATHLKRYKRNVLGSGSMVPQVTLDVYRCALVCVCVCGVCVCVCV